MIYIREKKIRKILKQILKTNKINFKIFDDTIDGLIWSSLRGIDSHGLNLFPQYLKEVFSGRVNLNPKIRYKKKFNNFISIDADHAMGHHACNKAVKYLIRLSNTTGIAMGNIYNSGHCGAMSYFGFDNVINGYLIIGMTQATPRIILKNTRKVFYGNNPLSLVCPINRRNNFAYDSCITSISFNKIRYLKRKRKKLPLNVAMDKFLKMTTDPEKAEYLMPIGDFKGTGLSLFVDILTGGLSNMNMASEVTSMYGDDIKTKRYLSQSFIVLNLNKICDFKTFKKNIHKSIKKIIYTEKINKKLNEPKYPGQKENETYIERSKTGIPLSNNLLNELGIKKNYV